jgi:hypothetical protein
MYHKLEESIKWTTKNFKLRFDMFHVKVMREDVIKEILQNYEAYCTLS